VHGYGYGYDALDRLTSATYPTALGLPASEAFAYDAAGNREDPSSGGLYDYDANNRITASPGKAWVYDGDGNPVSVNAGTGTQETFAHDAENRMRGYTNAANGASASYLSDSFARRIKKSVNGTATWFIWDGDQLLAQFDGAGDRDRRYAYTGGLAPAEQAVSDGSAEDVQAVHADHLDTPRGLSGGSAQAVWRAAYRAFGSTTLDEDPDADMANVAFAVRFPGQLADAESSLHYNRWRALDPSIGRYLSADPIARSRPFASQENLYAYAMSSPITRIDPLGLYYCVYSIGTHSMTCIPYDPNNSVFHSDKFVAGNNQNPTCSNCQNNEEHADVSDHGPIPPGFYRVEPKKPNSSRRPLTPDPNTKKNMHGRFAFQTHGCSNPATCSNGCIAATDNSTRDALNDALAKEEGRNDLVVVP
jgi:RHS repeat-associated protein